jgi:DNA polymerase V
MLMDIGPAGSRQQTLFTNDEADSRSAKMMLTLDSINREMGKNTLFLASSGIAKDWHMKQGNKSPCYTTNWGQLAQVCC